MKTREELLAEIQEEFPYGAPVTVQGVPSPENNFLPKQFGGKMIYINPLNAFYILWDGEPMKSICIFTAEGDENE